MSAYHRQKVVSKEQLRVNNLRCLETPWYNYWQTTIFRDEQTTIFRTLWPASTPEANWHHGLCTLRLQRSGTENPPHPPGLFHPVETETPVMAAGWVNHQQAVGNGGRFAPHRPIPGNMWIESLGTADPPQKKNWLSAVEHALSLGSEKKKNSEWVSAATVVSAVW